MIKKILAKNIYHQAFTMVEILLVIAMMTLLFGISLPVYQSMNVGTDLDNALKITVSTLRQAQVSASSVNGDSNWGVKLTGNNIVLFKGLTYATRDTTYDLSYTMPVGISHSGVNEVVFSKVQGETANTGTISISKYGRSQVITLNKYGAIDY